MRGRALLWVAVLLAVAIVPGGCAREPTEPVVVPPETTAPPSAPPTETPRPTPPPLSQVDIELELIAEDLDQPLFVTGAGDGSGRLFVVEQTGGIWLLSGTGANAERSLFLDLSSKVRAGGERGLLGLAFAPNFATSGQFFVDYTDRDGDTVVARVRAVGDRADPDSEETLLHIDQPYSNHNGGMVGFGPDGYLYVGMGDGGSGGDPHGNGQRLDTLLGKLLRIDVVGRASGYGVPPDNPFLGEPDARPEIWALGLRNPWRFSFDRESGDLWIGDVGQNAWEEIDFQPARSDGGENYGWNLFEGTHPYPPGTPGPEDRSRYTMPVVEYDHGAGISVTGGYVYRGEDEPDLYGTYIYADYGSGTIWGLRQGASGVENRALADSGRSISSFGEDDRGELYVCDRGGAVYRVRAK